MIREESEIERREPLKDMREVKLRCVAWRRSASAVRQILAPVLLNNQTNKCKSVTEADVIQQWASTEG